jgi:hypothetical protein
MSWLDSLALSRAWWLLLMLDVLVLGAENLLLFPLSVPYMREVSGQVYLDFCAFCSGATVNEQVVEFGPRGRALQLWLLPTVDVLIPVLSCLTAMVALRRFAPRQVRLLALPMATMLLDFAENAAIASVILSYPVQQPEVATLLGLLSGFKFVGYAATALSAMCAAMSWRAKRSP